MHSWLYSEKEKTVIEPCSNAMTECYYGFTLTKQEIADFRKEVAVGDSPSKNMN